MERSAAKNVYDAVTGTQKRAERREQQARETEASQERLRESIAETDRLVDEADQMLKRHHKEREKDDVEA